MSLKAEAISGARWTTASSLGVAAIQFCPTDRRRAHTVAQRFWSDGHGHGGHRFRPDFYGRGHRQPPSSTGRTTAQQALSSLYWLNVFAGAAVFLLTIAATPVVVTFFDEPRLEVLLPCVALLFLITPFGQLFQLLLQKELKFRDLALVEILSVIVGAVVAIGCAYRGLGGLLPWPLRQIGIACFTTVSLAMIVWRQWRPTFLFRTAAIRPYIRFGLFQLGDRGLNFLAARVDQIVIGAILGAGTLGIYNFAWNLAIMPVTRISPILTRIAFPVFAKVQLENERLKRGYLLMVGLLTTTNAPILVGGAAVASTLVPLALGPKWISVVPVLQVLAFVGLSRSIGNPIGSLLLSKGRPDLAFRFTACVVIVQIPAVYLGARIGGIAGVAWTVLVLQLGCRGSSLLFFCCALS